MRILNSILIILCLTSTLLAGNKKTPDLVAPTSATVTIVGSTSTTLPHRLLQRHLEDSELQVSPIMHNFCYYDEDCYFEVFYSLEEPCPECVTSIPIGSGGAWQVSYPHVTTLPDGNIVVSFPRDRFAYGTTTKTAIHQALLPSIEDVIRFLTLDPDKKLIRVVNDQSNKIVWLNVQEYEALEQPPLVKKTGKTYTVRTEGKSVSSNKK